MKYDAARVDIPMAITLLLRQGVQIQEINSACGVSRAAVDSWANGKHRPQKRSAMTALVRMADEILLPDDLKKCGVEVIK